MINRHQLLDCPDVVCQSRRHRGRSFNRLAGIRGFDFESGMDAAEVEVSHGQRDGQGEVLVFLGEAGREAGEAFIEMPERAVKPFRVGRANILVIGCAAKDAGFDGDALAGAVTAFVALHADVVTLVLLVLDGVVCAASGVVHDAFDKSCPTITGDLELLRHTRFDVANEVGPGLVVALAGQERDDQFGVLAGGEEGVEVASVSRVALAALVGNKRPALVDLNRLALEVAELVVEELRALATGGLEHVQNRASVEARQAGNGAYSKPLTEQLEDLGGLGGFDSDPGEWLGFRGSFSAADAAETLDDTVSIFELAELFRFTLTAVTGHPCLSQGVRLQSFCSQEQQLLAANAFGCGPLVFLAPPGLCYLQGKITSGGWTYTVQVEHVSLQWFMEEKT